MKLLLAGGTAALQRSIVSAVLREGHQARVLAREPDKWPAEWAAGVEPRPASSDPTDLEAAALGCAGAIVIDASVTQTPVVDADPAEQVIAAAQRAGVRRVVRVSSAGSEDAAIPVPEWVQLRSGVIYGIGDDPITVFLIMMRSLPAVPFLTSSQPARPTWHEDVARAASAALSLPAARVNRVVDICGPDRVDAHELYERIAALIDRRPLRIPVPEFIANHGSRVAAALNIPIPLAASHLRFGGGADEGCQPDDGTLANLLGVAPTSFEAGLKRLLNGLDELTPLEGIGSVEVKRFSVDIPDSRYDAAALLRVFRERFQDVMPVDVGVEPGSAQVELTTGAVVTIALPGRGHVQVRVEEVTNEHVVVSTLRGHALAGIVRFGTRAVDGGVRFEVMTCDAAANLLDWLALTLGGARIQDANWMKVVGNVAQLAGSTPAAVQSDARKLSDDEVQHVQRWIEAIIERQRTASAETGSPR